MAKFDVGEGSGWHIHYDHIKFGNNKKSRVEFNERTAEKIIEDINFAVDRWGLSTSGYFDSCIDWIKENY